MSVNNHEMRALTVKKQIEQKTKSSQYTKKWKLTIILTTTFQFINKDTNPIFSQSVNTYTYRKKVYIYLNIDLKSPVTYSNPIYCKISLLIDILRLVSWAEYSI